MIYFDGKALENVAPVMIEDIMVSPIQLSPVARQRPIRFGSQFVRMTGGQRTVDITFGLMTNDPTKRTAQMQALTNWARSDSEKRLELPNYQNKYLTCICTALPEPSMRQWWESRLRFVFTCFDDPYWNSIEEKSATCGTAFFAGGNAPPRMRIENTFSASASDVAYSDGTNTATFSTVPAGDLVIDLTRQTAAVGGTSIMQYYTFGSKFPVPIAGTQTITGTGTIKFRERWQ